MRRTTARQRVSRQQLTGVLIHRAMSCILPKRNDYGTASFEEQVPELARLGITTRGRFRRLMTRHRRQLLLVIDRDQLRRWEVRHMSESFGERAVIVEQEN